MVGSAKRDGVKPMKGKGETHGGKRESDPFGFRSDPDLELFLLVGGAWMGERGTLAGTIAALERGTVGSSGIPNTDLYDDQQLGLGAYVGGLIERHRWFSNIWRSLESKTQQVLLACYSAPPAILRSDEGFGAKDYCPPVEAIERGHIEPHRGRHPSTRTGVEAQLGPLATLAFMLTDNPAELLNACTQASKGKSGRLIRREARRARDAARDAHRAWIGAKRAAGAPPWAKPVAEEVSQ